MLSSNWLTDGLLDFEYKKYLLLAYFKQVNAHFDALQLYPIFSDVLAHKQQLKTLYEEKSLLKTKFPQQLRGIDGKEKQLQYMPKFEADEASKELEKIIEFALPNFQQAAQQGSLLYETIEKQINLEPLGLLPTYFSEGLLLLSMFKNRCVEIYKYQISIFTQANERYRSLSLQWLERVPKSLAQTYESLKIDLIRRYQFTASPAAFLAESNMLCPLEEALLPITKRRLMRLVYELETK
ncbi:MAG: hypothetical protein EAZ57_04395 [Cytophagales bacterium]|nr:MAG: hypothetical protein EAZ67_05415 [Cytophagales bacterium]TAF61235.1 MAG: hypothetical protein EAZ57_04395 [Cytophagales bacterium]